MANPFYEPGQQRAAKVNDLFAAIARRYDRLNDLQSAGLHRLWKRRLVRLAHVSPGIRALDVCCGTGDIALRLARSGAEVTGLDFSEAMLTVAGERQKAEGGRQKGRVSFIHGDAQALPFGDAEFGIVTVGYGLRNLANWETGLREMVRVAKPDGRLLVLDFGKPGNPLWRGLYFGYLRLAVPLLGRLFAGSADAYAYILESLRHYPAQLGVAAKMTELGLVEVQTLNFLGGAMSIHRAVKRGG
jgi:demethylmenaquinone methyltransferase / 2-methoxy-6-polyprenyl-1,4-benzoquinol methylase